MTPPPRQRYGVSLALCSALLSISVASAQQPSTNTGKFAAATLPESNEALLYSSRVEEAIQAGDYRLAVELIERLLDLPAGLVAAPASRNYYPVWRQAFRLQGQLPGAGVELYRQLHDAEVDARFGQAAAHADLAALRELFHGYRLSTAWPAIGAELVAHLLDQGAYGEAIEVLREVMPRGDRVRTGDGLAGIPEQKAQLVVALAGAGALGPARRLLDELSSELGPDAQPARVQRLEQLERWLTALHGEQAGIATEAREPLTPCIEAGPVWHQTLAADGRAHTGDDGADIADAASALRRLPMQHPVLAEDLLVVRLHRRLWAFDPQTLLPRWNASERLLGVSEGMSTAVSGAAGDDDVRLSPDAESLLSDHLGHVVSTGFGKVYAVERLGSFDADFGMFGRRPFQTAREVSTRNELVARDLESGRIAWRTTAEAASPLYDVVFQNVPIVVADSLVAPMQRGDELLLAVLDPADGSLIREVSLVGPPTYFTGAGGRCLIVSDPTTLYVCTGNGVVAALTREDLSWKWAAVYPSTLAQHLTQWWWQPTETTVESNIDSPLIADDLLIVAPVDSPDMFALDRFDGRERWRMSRREYPYLIGALPGAMVVAGRELACLDLDDPAGREARWRSVPLRITGRAVIRDERIFVPTRDGIVLIDGRNGKVLADQTAAVGQRADLDEPSETDPSAAESAMVLGGGAAPDYTANLLVAGDTLFSVSPSRIVKYPDLLRVGARYAGGVEERIPGEAEELVRAWLDALDGRHEAAFARLQTCSFDDPQLAAARDQLLTYVFLGLAEDAPVGEDRLGWLQRASALADSPDSATELAITIGQALEGSGEWAAALRHYGRLLRQPEVGHVADRADPGRRVAGWLHAAERIGQTRAVAPSDALRDLLDQALSHGDRRVENLQRLLVALEDGSEHDRVAQLLTLQKLAPELKVRYLPDARAADLPVRLRRRLHLERWDTHVSLGWLEQARADQAVWDEQFADAPTPDAAEPALTGYEPLSADEQRDRAEAIDLAFRKLAQIEDQPFTPRVTRQWKIERAELLLDLRRPLAASRPWILIADLGQHRIALINAFKHQHPQRQTEDRMLTTGDDTDAGQPYGPAIGRRFEWEGGRRTAWPAVIQQQLAAVPVRGGLVCVGLGPERYAGRRQWEYAVPEWSVVPAGFTHQSVGGRHGVFFTPRRDRVALVGWSDGQLWWQRELSGVTIQRLHIIDKPPTRDSADAGELLVIVDENQRIWVTDATYGRRLQSVETTVAAPQRVDVVGGTIVVWGLESAAGIDSGTLKQVWQQAFPLVADTVIVEAARVEARGSSDYSPPWIAYRTRGQSDWHLLDARDGRPVFEASLGEFDAVSAIAADSEWILVAGSAGPPGDEGEQRHVRLSALNLADGQRRWSRDFSTAVEVNPTQLAAHRDLIPMLLAGGGGGAEETDLPAIQLVSKRDGELGELLSIKTDFRPAVEATCEMYMLVTPTRMIVQAGGNLIAYGNSPLQPGP